MVNDSGSLFKIVVSFINIDNNIKPLLQLVLILWPQFTLLLILNLYSPLDLIDFFTN